MTAVATSDLFISYADDAQAWVEGYLLDALGQAGVSCRSEAAFALGVPRVLEFERAVRESQRTLLVISPRYLVDDTSHFVGLLAMTYGLQTSSWPVIPLLLDESLALPPRLGLLTRLEAADPERWPEMVARLCAELRRPRPQEPPPLDCPYPGLVAFGARDAGQFHGREAEVMAMVDHMRVQRLLLVVGPSGSGKSSLISAGFLPALLSGKYFARGAWVVRRLRPSDPTLRAFTLRRPPNPARAAIVVRTLLEQHPGASRVLLVIDQLEELFTQVDRAAQRRYIAALQMLRSVEQCSLLIAMRADFFPDLMDSPLWPIPPSQRLELAPIQGEALEHAIRLPAEQSGVHIEPRLVERLMADAADEPGALPLVQEALVLLWGRIRRRYIALADYERFGSGGRTGLAAAMSIRADATLDALTPEQRTIACRIFLRLVQFGEGRANTRRHMPRADLRTVGDDAQLFDRTLQHLVDRRLLTLNSVVISNRGQSQPNGGAPIVSYVDIAHEALISGWTTLRHWIEERRDDEQTRRRLEAQASEWRRLGERGGLLDEIELAEAQRWLEKPAAAELGSSEQLQRLVAASRAEIEREAAEAAAAQRRELESAQALVAEREGRLREQHRTNTRLRWLVAGLALAVLSALLLALYARTQAQIALGRQLAAEADGLREDQLDLALLLGIEAFHSTGIPEARNSLIAARQRSPYLAAFLRRHTLEVSSVAFDPSGHLFASAGCGHIGTEGVCERGIVQLWDAAKRREAGAALSDFPGDIFSIAFSPDGRQLAAAGCWRYEPPGNCGAGAILLWDVSTRALLGEPLLGHAHEIFTIAYSPDGRSLASAGLDGTIVLWDVAGRAMRFSPLVTNTERVSSLAFAPDNLTLAAAGANGSIQLWSVTTGQLLYTLETERTSLVRSVRFSPTQPLLASADLDGSIMLWDLKTHQRKSQRFVGHTDQVRSLAFSPDGRLLASGGRDKRIILWRADTGQRVGAEFLGHSDSVNDLAFSPDGRMLASAGQDAAVIAWDLGDQLPLLGHISEITDVAVDPAGALVVSTGCAVRQAGKCLQGEIRRWSVASHAPVGLPLPAHAARINAVAFSPIAGRAASVGEDGTLVVWDTNSWTMLEPPFVTSLIRIEDVTFSIDGSRLAIGGCAHQRDSSSACDRGGFELWDTRQLARIGDPIHAHRDSIESLAFSPDGRTIATGSLDRTVRLWASEGLRPLGEPLVGHTNRVYSVAFSPGGHILASAGADQHVILWDVGRRRPLAEPLIGHRDSIYALAFSPAGDTVASTGADGLVLLWDVARHLRIGGAIQGHTGSILSLAFSPGSRMLVSAGVDRAVMIWDVNYLFEYDVASWRQEVCATVRRSLSDSEWERYGGGLRLGGQSTCIAS
jgi:WD40 repeat protein